MAADQTRDLLDMLGAMLQMATIALVLALMVLLERRMRVRHFGWWTAGWVLLLVAAVAAGARIVVLPMLLGVRLDVARAAAPVMAAVHHVAGVGALVLFLRGALAYAGRPVGARWTAMFIMLLGGMAIPVAIGVRPGQLPLWQAPLAVLALSACSSLLLRLPADRRGSGSRVTGTAFGAGGLLWATYLSSSILAGLPGAFATWPALGSITRYVRFADLFLTTALGIGMVVLLMEDVVRALARAKSEAEAAIAELAGAHRRLRLLATTDALTGCLNRQGLQEWLDSPPRGVPGGGAVLVLDMDNLKPVNDAYGHGAGDAMLRQLAAVLRGVARSTGVLCRWGGDEFLLVLPGADVQAARDLCESALAVAPRLRLPGSTTELRLEASMGVAAYQGLDDVPAAIRRADGGMYRHKQRRRTQSGAYPVTQG